MTRRRSRLRHALLPIISSITTLLLLVLRLAPAQAFLSSQLRLATRAGPSSDYPAAPSQTRRHSDAFFNFEGLKRKLNLTHFPDPAMNQAPPLPEEDFGARPDLVKAREIGRVVREELERDAPVVSVSLYFHVAHHHLQSYREALEVRGP